MKPTLNPLISLPVVNWEISIPADREVRKYINTNKLTHLVTQEQPVKHALEFNRTTNSHLSDKLSIGLEEHMHSDVRCEEEVQSQYSRQDCR